ncbi:hypothetical protein FLA_3078 [Filimonas lacunae]|nr:hypothetical protein FLA_3078 [Filimonas lacunae]
MKQKHYVSTEARGNAEHEVYYHYIKGGVLYIRASVSLDPALQVEQKPAF